MPCPTCGKRARRETDVSDTFLDSAWYYLRYPSTRVRRPPVRPGAHRRSGARSRRYIGGNEHAVLHLLYSRFIAMVLHELGHVDFEEPFRQFRAHGLIVKDGAKMSKSKGNVVIPDEYIDRWGADSFRMYLMFLGPFQEGGDFRDAGINGIRRFLDKVWQLVGAGVAEGERGGELLRPVLLKWHHTKKKVTDDLESLSYNTAIAAMMEMLNTIRESSSCEHEHGRGIRGACWRPSRRTSPRSAGSDWATPRRCSMRRWPGYDPALLVDETAEVAVQVSGKTRGRVTVAAQRHGGGGGRGGAAPSRRSRSSSRASRCRR